MRRILRLRGGVGVLDYRGGKQKSWNFGGAPWENTHPIETPYDKTPTTNINNKTPPRREFLLDRRLPRLPTAASFPGATVRLIEYTYNQGRIARILNAEHTPFSTTSGGAPQQTRKPKKYQTNTHIL